MNSYYLGFELPAEHRAKLVTTQQHVRHMFTDRTRILGMDEFHVTSLFLGKCPRSAAEDLCDSLAWGFGSIYFRFDGTEAFKNSKGPHALVLKLHDLYGNALLMNRWLQTAASKHPDIGMSGVRWGYNPHITLAKCKDDVDSGLVTASDDINNRIPHNVTKHEFYCDDLVLYEKVDGSSSYEAYRMLRLR